MVGVIAYSEAFGFPATPGGYHLFTMATRHHRDFSEGGGAAPGVIEMDAGDLVMRLFTAGDVTSGPGGDGHAKVFVAVDDSFAVFGIAAFGTSGWLRRVPINGGSMVYDNTDNDAQAEFSILISGATRPIAVHFVL